MDVSMIGYQFTIGFDPALFELITVEQFGLENMTIDNFGFNKIDEGMLLANWAPSNNTDPIDEGTMLFQLKLMARSTTQLAGHLWIQNDPLTNEVYIKNKNTAVQVHPFELQILDNEMDRSGQVVLFQNTPNPFSTETKIRFQLPEATTVDLKIHDTTGKVVWSQQQFYKQGDHEIKINGSDLGTDGIYVCTLNTTIGNETIKLVYISNF